MNPLRPSPQDYDPKERKDATWWSSRKGRSTGRSAESLKRGRRITLLDMLLLAVMAGVLVPWLLVLDRSENLGPYTVSFEEVHRGGDPYLVLKIRLPRGAEAMDDPLSWTVSGSDGDVLFAEGDLPPKTGDTLTVRYKAEKQGDFSCRINSGVESLILSTEKNH